MVEAIPETHKDLLERPIVVTLATVMPDGTPQATPVWCSYDGTYIYINTARGRQKDNNMTERPHVAICSIDPDNPYRYLQVRGEVIEEIDDQDEAVAHINELASMYLGKDDYYAATNPDRRGKETRVKYKIEPKSAHRY